MFIYVLKNNEKQYNDYGNLQFGYFPLEYFL